MNTIINRSNYKYDIFISYSKHDKDFVKSLVRELKKYGYRIWRDRDILYKYAGDKYLPRVEEGIDESALVLYIHSGASCRSKFVQQIELPYAIEKGKQILMYRYKIKSMPKMLELARRQAIETPEDPELAGKGPLFDILMAVRVNFGELSPEGQYVKLETNHEIWSPEQINARLTDSEFILPVPTSRREVLEAHHFVCRSSADTRLFTRLRDFLTACDLQEDIDAFIERKSCEVADYFMERIRMHKTIFNGPMLGVASITAHRSADGKEVHSIDLEMYSSDYFTFKVVSGIYKELIQRENSEELFNIRSIADIPRFAPFLSSLGMGGFMLLDKGDALRALWIKRSDECEAGRRYHFSYDETVGVKDVNPDNRRVDVYNTLYRGMNEELGLTPKELTGQGGIFEIGVILTDDRIELEMLSYQQMTLKAYERFALLLEAADDSKLEVGNPYFWTMDEYKRELVNKTLTPEALALIQRLEVRNFKIDHDENLEKSE